MIRLLLALALVAGHSLSAAEEENTVTLQLPPASLEKWYRPVNKRDVWLHTMFRLRREMQAVSEYAALEDRTRLQKWLARLEKDYLSIGEMVPEWKDELEDGLFGKMQAAAQAGDAGTLARVQEKLGKSCQSCHAEYKLTAALRYRAPDFASVKVESEETMEEEDYSRVMSRLSMLLNRVKIAGEDGRRKAAVDALDQLEARLADLGASCSACHKEESTRDGILGETARASLAAVRKGLEAGDQKQQGRYLGEFAVGVCADCHAIHRLQSDMRGLLSAD
jgi:mono/diheme cytochrome c family protein